MLHDRVLSDSRLTPFTASSRLVGRHQSEDVGHVRHVTWTGYPPPHYDVITAQYVYSQRPTMCDRSWSDVTATQCPYVDGYLPPITDWTSTQSAAVAASTFWGCTTDDRVLTMPCSSSPVQFGAGYSATDGVVHGWQLERPSTEMATNFHSSGTSALTPMNCELIASSQSTFNNERHLQQTHVPHQPLRNVTSSSQLIIDDDRKHRFGTRPTRASTSIGKTRTREKYRTVYNERQKRQLEEQYIANTYISAEQKANIARDVGLTERQVKIWFQNRRAKDRRQKYQSSDEDQSTPQHHFHLQQQQQHLSSRLL